ncbi:M56 family metallopeptidase [Hymenobacter cellulosivorans]|uniref:M48 family metalloprotease n=1 Tax=Hymenobacter cellulosivorans TaxID=2932249 RepID=A0ABY4FEQ3_9BACT|nr:M56 family metallopeptidase [Hymenobacter cellulosivorans]UOQ52931.1 M48 family metalloprotease [Hymenobacter cellulosivorans]
MTPELVRAVGWTIVHSLWQGAIVGLALVGLLLVLRRHSAQVRYNVAGLALVIMLGLALVTFGRHYALALTAKTPVAAASAATPAASAASLTLLAPAAASSAVVAEQSVSLLETGRQYFDQHLPLIVAAWFLGLLAMTLRMLGGLAYVQRLRHYRVEPLSEQWNERFKALAARAGIKRTVTLLESALVKAPLVAGHLKPVILLPLGTVMGLSQAQLEAILAHELAHIARRDYLMNILQSVAEILFFYHPAAWFITACMRTERENCCDDEATAICGDPLTLAKALAALAEMGQNVYPTPRLALSAVGPDGSLLGRIRRLVQRRAAPTFSEGFMAALVVVGGLALIGLTTVVAMANPRPWPERAKELVGAVFGPENSMWAKSLPAFQTATAPAAPIGDDDDKKKRKSKSKDDKHVVIVRDAQEGQVMRRGKDGGTVVVKRDKKGRVTELYVDGQRIDMEEATAKPKAKANTTEIIRLAPSSRTARRSGSNSNFNFDFDSHNFGMSARDQEELRSSMQRLEQDLARSGDEIRRARTYVLADGNRVEIRAGKDASIANDRIAAKALQEAESSLREAERNETDARAREKIREELDRVRERRDELRERQQEANEAARERQEADRERQQAERERQQAEREVRQAERERAQAERERARAIREEQSRKVEEAMIDELEKDKLIKDKKYFQLVLKGNEMVVDGQKQSEAVAAKYRKLFEDGTGRTIGSTGSVVFSNTGNDRNRIYSNTTSSSSDMPTPPAPPAPPRAPKAPRSSSLAPVPPVPPTPPRAPRAPRNVKVNSVALGEQLRKDGLIDANSRSYQFQLNPSGMTVNGQRQPEETAKRYRELLGKTDGKNFNMDVVITE